MKGLEELAKRYGYIAYPILFALFPLLSFYGSNIAEIRSQDFQVFVFLVFNLGVAVVFWVISLILVRSFQKASILTVAFLAVFFVFGRVHASLGTFSIPAPIVPLGPTKIVLIISLIIVALVWLVVRRLRPESIEKLNATLTLVGSVLIVGSVFPVAASYISNPSNSASNQNPVPVTSPDGKIARENLPDIYYLVLDGYSRADQLQQKFGYDNSGFTGSLEERGFYVADKANSNYAHTHFSLPSTLNMKYLNYLADELGEESVDRLPLKGLLEDNEAVPLFKSLGYKHIMIGSRWSWTLSSPQADIEIKPIKSTESKILNIPIDEFALVYMQTTAMRPWIATSIRGDLISQIVGAFQRAEQVPEINEPTMTFIHVNSPHPPYLFDRNGILQGKSKLELENDSFSDRDAYVEQTMYANQLVIRMVDEILRKSDKPPIIIVASDHGSAAALKRKDFEETDRNKLNIEGIRERMGILNAYYFPDRDYSNLYPGITPVNSFRLILKQYMKQDIDLLPDKSYFSDNSINEYRMTDVTELVN